jgi:hypothetical protein
MANCPSCGSDHIQLKKETNVSWGRAAAGWALFGVVGGAVGAITGEDRNVNACLNCGTSWKAGDLFKTIQIIKSSTGMNLNLARDEDRLYLNTFMVELSPYLEEIAKKEKEGKKLLEEVENKSVESTAAGCSVGCVMSIGGCSAIASSVSGGGIFLMLLIPPLVGLLIGMLADSANKKSIEKKKEETTRRVEMMKRDAEEKFRNKVKIFKNNNPL